MTRLDYIGDVLRVMSAGSGSEKEDMDTDDAIEIVRERIQASNWWRS